MQLTRGVWKTQWNSGFPARSLTVAQFRPPPFELFDEGIRPACTKAPGGHGAKETTLAVPTTKGTQRE